MTARMPSPSLSNISASYFMNILNAKRFSTLFVRWLHDEWWSSELLHDLRHYPRRAGMTSFDSVERALRSYFSRDSSVPDAEDPLQFRAQMLLHDDESHEAPTTNHVLVGVSDAAYVTQLAVILCAWHSIGSNPLQSLEKSTEAIEGVTPAFSSRQRVLGVSVDKIHEFVRTVEEGDALTATTELIDELGGARGILTLLGFQQTVGSRDLAPLTFRQCLAAFTERHTRDEPLTVGARAFSKHCARSSSGWWGEMMGNDAAKNARAEIKVRELLVSATWKNIHSLPHAHATMEIRNALGYGARWDAESGTFRGFLEPPMLHGHEIKWRH